MSKKIKEITAQELHKELQGHKKDLTVINVLPHDYFSDCSIEHSINIPYDDLASDLSEWDRNAKIVVYCAKYECHLSAKAYELLVSLGFTNVFAYEGGIKEWYELGLPSKGACKMDYLRESHGKKK